MFLFLKRGTRVCPPRRTFAAASEKFSNSQVCGLDTTFRAYMSCYKYYLSLRVLLTEGRREVMMMKMMISDASFADLIKASN